MAKPRVLADAWGAVSRSLALRLTEILCPTWRDAERTLPGVADVRSVLVIRLDEIGDVVMTSPFLRELRRNLPAARIVLMVKPSVLNLVERCPYVDEVLTFGGSAASLRWPVLRVVRATCFARRTLSPRRFDVALVPRWDTDWYQAAFIAHLSRARYRVGYSERVNALKRRLNRGYDRLFTHVMCDEGAGHEVDRNLAMLAFLGYAVESEGLEVWTTAEDEAFADGVVGEGDGRAGERLVAFGAGGRHARRRWPIERFVDLGRLLRAEYGCRIVEVGGRSDADLATALRRGLGETMIVLPDPPTLRQAAALLRRCRVFVGNDSGPKHLAEAAGVPIAEISWAARKSEGLAHGMVRRFRPWGVPYEIVAPEDSLAPCGEECGAGEPHCIKGVTVEMVWEAVRRCLDRGACPR